MFNKEFYPTPKSLIEKMFEPYKSKYGYSIGDISILEPSAGKGDILDFIKEQNHRADLNAIEINDELRYILHEKGYPVISNDFLKYNEPYDWQLIVMNPPFSNGDDHLYHAINLASNTDIICVLNAETIKNPYTKRRKLLLQYIKEYGSYEFIEQAFVAAERKTAVEIALVRLRIEKDVHQFDFNLKKEKERIVEFDEEIQESSLALKDLIGNLQIQNEQVLSAYVEKLKADDIFKYKLNNMTGIADNYEYKNFILTEGSNTRKYNHVLKNLKIHMWRKAIRELDVSKYMSNKVYENFEKMIAQQTNVAFTKENVALFFQTIMNNRVSIWQQAVVDVFDELTKYYHENRMHIEGWKTNDKFKINRKVILPNWVKYDGDYCDSSYLKTYGAVMRMDYHNERKYNDIDKVMDFISGNHTYDDQSIHYVLKAKFEKLGKIKTGDKFDSSCSSYYFDIKFYKKGTVHLYFKSKDLWERFNMIACHGKQWLPEKEQKQWDFKMQKQNSKFTDDSPIVGLLN